MNVTSGPGEARKAAATRVTGVSLLHKLKCKGRSGQARSAGVSSLTYKGKHIDIDSQVADLCTRPAMTMMDRGGLFFELSCVLK